MSSSTLEDEILSSLPNHQKIRYSIVFNLRREAIKKVHALLKRNTVNNKDFSCIGEPKTGKGKMRREIKP